MWIVLGSELGEGTRPHQVSIVGAEGALVHTAMLECTVVPCPRVRDRVLATVVRDELGVESVQLYRVDGSGRFELRLPTRPPITTPVAGT